MGLNLVFEIAGVILMILCIAVAMYDLPGLLSLVGLKRASYWLEQRMPSIKILDRMNRMYE
jgi:hypothetical protein